MAKISIYNGTDCDITLHAGGEEKKIGPFKDGYIDTVLSSITYHIDSNGKTIADGSGDISAVDSYSFLVYRNYSKGGQLYLGSPHKLTDGYPVKMRDLAKATYNKLEELKKENMTVDV